MGGVNPEPNSQNPFESPQTQADVHPGDVAPLAARNARALAVSIDGLLYMLAMTPVFFVFARAEEDGDAALLFGGLSGLAVLALVVYQAYLVSTTGQSIGKKVLGIRIVRLNRSPVDFVHGVLLRSWLMGAMTGIPLIGSFISLADILLIFAEDRRCLHDRIADTIVIESGSGPTRSGSGEIPTNPWAR